DAADHNLPLMYWYAAEPLAEKEPERALKLAANSKIPLLLPYMVRRVGSIGTPESLHVLVAGLARTEDLTVQRAFLRGLGEALRGRRQVPMPAAWPETFGRLVRSSDAEVRSLAQSLGVIFGDSQAFDALRKVLADPRAEASVRQTALASLVAGRDQALPPL